MPKNSKLVEDALKETGELETVTQDSGFRMVIRTISKLPNSGLQGPVSAEYFMDYISLYMKNGWKVVNTAVVGSTQQTLDVAVFLTK
jgi:hypothetical protein